MRQDAARNRRAILLATEELLSRHRPDEVTIEQVALAAGVGKGTVFHRFGNRHGLMRALMQERAHDLEVAVTTGPPPLGDGAPARDRLLAFLSAVVEVVARNKGLLAALGPAAPASAAPEHAPPRETHPVYRFWHDHIADQVREQRPDLDADMLAHVFLAALHSQPILDALERGDGQRLNRTLHDLAIGLLPE